jgi:two-component system, cell cycle response regulator DivK
MNKGIILITEDNPSNMKLMRDVLSFQGYGIIEAVDGKQSIELVKEFKDKIDLILLDIQLPVLNGFEVMEILKADPALKNIPIFVVSAYAMESDIQKAHEFGCESYITKPVNLPDFISKINQFFKIKKK